MMKIFLFIVALVVVSGAHSVRHSKTTTKAVPISTFIEVTESILKSVQEEHDTLDDAIKDLSKRLDQPIVENPLGYQDDELKYIRAIDISPCFTSIDVDYGDNAVDDVKKLIQIHDDMKAELEKQSSSFLELSKDQQHTAVSGFTFAKIGVWITAAALAIPTGGVSLAVAPAVNLGIGGAQIATDLSNNRTASAGATAAGMVVGALIPGGGAATDIITDVVTDAATDALTDVATDMSSDAIAATAEATGHIVADLAHVEGRIIHAAVDHATKGNFLQTSVGQKGENLVELATFRQMRDVIADIRARRKGECYFEKTGRNWDDKLPSELEDLQRMNEDEAAQIENFEKTPKAVLKALDKKFAECKTD